MNLKLIEGDQNTMHDQATSSMMDFILHGNDDSLEDALDADRRLSKRADLQAVDNEQ